MANSPSSNIYGRDLACVANADGVIDLTPEMSEVTGLDVLAQSLVRRQLTAKGSDPASPNDGIDLRAMLRAGITQTELSLIATQVQKELIQDQRVLPSTTVTGTFNSSTNVLTLVETIQTNNGPFTLTISVDAVTYAVLVNGG